MDTIYINQKNKFSQLHSQYSRFLNFLDKSKNLKRDDLIKIIKLNNDIDAIISNLIDIEHNIIKDLDIKEYEDEIKEHDENSKILNSFLPYMLSWKMNSNV